MELKGRIKNFGAGKPLDFHTIKEKKIQDITEPQEQAFEPLKLDVLNMVEMSFKDKIHAKLLDILDLSLISSLEKDEAGKQIKEITSRLINEQSIPVNNRAKNLISKSIVDDVLGFGPLEILLDEPSIADILINGWDSIYVERFGLLELTPLRFSSNDHLMKVIDKIVSQVGRRIDESSPMVDARLPDGSRVNAIVPPLAIDGPSLSIRRFAVDKMKLDDLAEKDALTTQMATFLKGVAKAKLNILISGGTGTGKTTLLNAVSNYVPHNERVVTIEDSAELQLQLEHVVRLETRPQNIEGRGEISLRDLVRNSLRMRPDRIIIGEVRSGEAFDMLQAMNTGHDGSLTTVHANNSRDALARLENMVSMAGFELPAKAVRAQIASAINIIVQLARLEDGSRRIISIQEVSGMEGDIITLSEIFKYARQGIDDQGKVNGQFVATGLVPKCLNKLKRMGVDINMSVFTENVGINRGGL